MTDAAFSIMALMRFGESLALHGTTNDSSQIVESQVLGQDDFLSHCWS
ncbi:hypothetical protein SAMN04488515_2462 [Cognatiyoonia koreensis]|uniref:Uncharacterized protein n=1 Tax=Cognatiyoonia koreensis TaxID=364200 RepID=A0A1I0RCR9_9RHOB|nr:hypothetical protein [Cognatiyoonia koreensis]SEW38391.1 hypothetical protein SAMN04488515_2462 [Cognatiyoonia koreensis]